MISLLIFVVIAAIVLGAVKAIFPETDDRLLRLAYVLVALIVVLWLVNIFFPGHIPTGRGF